MALLNSDQVKGFELVAFGRAWINFEASTVSSTLEIGKYTVNHSNNGGFFVGAGGAVSVITTNNVYVKTASGWVNVQEIYVNVSGNWKRVVSDKFFVKTSGGQWRS